MSCTPEWGERISAYHDGELSADEASQVERHLASCSTCARWLEELRADEAAVTEAGLRPVLADGRPLGPDLAQPRIRWSRLWRPAFVAAPAVALAIAVIVAVLPRARTPVAPRESRTAPARTPLAGVSAETPPPAPAIPAPADVPKEMKRRSWDSWENPDAFHGQPGATDGYAPSKAAAPPTGPMLVQMASMDLRVRSYQRAEADVRRLAAKQGGVITGGESSKDDDHVYGTITVRVPADRLVTLMAEVGALGEVTQKQLKSQEVTDEFIDLQARLRNYQREEDQLLRLMGRAGKLSDLLTVERTLADVRGRIEQVSGRLRYLRDRVDMSALTVALDERAKTTAPVAQWSAWEVVKRAVSGLLAALRTIAEAIIWLLILGAIPLVAAAVVWRALRRRSTRASSGA
jgi:anti-sigma factor RsiW